MTDDSATTAGTLLGGRLRYAQPAHGYRTGLEPVLLAASIPARAGDRVLEAGTGAGAGLLCLAARVPGIEGVGVERDPAMAALAVANAAANGFAQLRMETATIEDWPGDGVFDHAFANPPWHADSGSPSPNKARLAAKQAAPGLLAAWCAALARHLRPRGTLSLIVPASAWVAAASALAAAKCAEQTLVPLWPRDAVAARLVIMRGVRLGRGGCVLAPGLVLHGAEGGITAAAEAVLRESGSLR